MFKNKNFENPSQFIWQICFISKPISVIFFISIVCIISLGCTASSTTQNENTATTPLPPNKTAEPSVPTPTKVITDSQDTTDQSIESSSSNAFTPITAQLTLSKAPTLNEPVSLSFQFSSTQPAPQTVANIILPDGAILIDGKLEWQGDLEPGKVETIEAIISFEKEGNLTLEAKALHEVGNGDIWGDDAYIYLTVLPEEGQFGFTSDPIDNAANNEKPTPPSVEPED